MSDLELLQGTLDVLVLKTLTWGPRHGYAIARWIRETTQEELQVVDGALYTALHRMEKRHWLEAEWGLTDERRRARFYRLTAAGRSALQTRSEQWDRYATAVTRVLRTA